MKKLFLLWFAMGLFAGCANQDMVNEIARNDQVVITAEKSPVLQGDVSEGPLLRTSIDVTTTPMHTYWSTGDEFELHETNNSDFSGNNGGTYEFAYSGSGSDNVAVGSFINKTGNVSPGNYVAVYPYSRAMLVTGAGTEGNGDIHLDLHAENQIGNGNYDNFGSNAFMYSSIVNVDKTKSLDAEAGVTKASTGIYFYHAAAFLVFNIKNIPAGTTLYQIFIQSPETLWRTAAITAKGTAIYVNSTPTIKLFTDSIGKTADDGNGNTINTGTYTGGMVINPCLSAGGYVYVYFRTRTNTGDLACYGYRVTFPNGIEASKYYPVTAAWSDLTEVTDVWNGTKYSIPHIVGNNILIRTPEELRWVEGVCNGNGHVPQYDMGGVTSKNDATSFNFQGYTITLACDIDLNGKTWSPIGASSNEAFSGTFDGAGHNISNFSVDTTVPTRSYGDIFGTLANGSKGGKVINLFVKNTRVAP